ncbi:MAG: hypothetical protein QM778_38890 [Myxococcales bacterium]
MYFLIPVLLLLHGVAHLVGFVGAFRWVPQIVQQSSVLSGRVSIGEGTSKIFGVLWLLCAVAFVVAAGGAAVRSGWWQALTFYTAPLSLLLSLTFWPEARLGVPINLLIIGMMLFSRWSAWPFGVD